MQLLLEAEEPGNPRSLFRVSVNGMLVGAGLTAMQAHLVVGDALEAFVLPGRKERSATQPQAVDRRR